MKSPSPSQERLTAVSLFCSSGIGDLGFRAAGAEVLVANELLSDRAALFSMNFPETEVLVGDIRELGERIISCSRERLEGRELDVLFATPPCQGMSKNGRGKLLRGVRDGLRDALDPRNQLATFVPPIVRELRPGLVVFENVPEMDGTLVEDDSGELVDLLDLLAREMDGYTGAWRVLEFADFGVPQRRQRLITIFVRNDLAVERGLEDRSDVLARLYPVPTHAPEPTLHQAQWLSVSDAIGDLPPLDASSTHAARHDAIEFHYVPLLDERKYWWVSNTPPGASAFDNQCVEPGCGFDRNATHGAERDTGINRSRLDTPIYCQECGALLPRPVVDDGSGPRLMKGFTSAYKRMRADLPASALTRNLSYACSDQKIHPDQNRVLSLHEAMVLHTISDYGFEWTLPSGKRASDKLIRDSIGESIPPRGLEVVFRHVFAEVFDFVSGKSANAA
jgi:DNA (cytosine-5)-methyltransferase 1